MAISAKGGHNAENHNHNDVGSYTVVMGNKTMAGDQGGPFSYPGDYFSRGATEKYNIKGSFGHPVPLVAGTAQATGAQAKGIVTEKTLTDTKDTFGIDLTSAYPARGLEQLIRTFTYDRSEGGSFQVSDDFRADSPVTFETALTTAADWKLLDDGHILLTSGEEKMTVQIEASGKVEFTSETISVNSPAYTRIGIRLAGNSKYGYIHLNYTPNIPSNIITN